MAWVTQLQIDVMARSIEQEEREVQTGAARIERMRVQLEIARQAHEVDVSKLAIRRDQLRQLIERKATQSR